MCYLVTQRKPVNIAVQTELNPLRHILFHHVNHTYSAQQFQMGQQFRPEVLDSLVCFCVELFLFSEVLYCSFATDGKKVNVWTRRKRVNLCLVRTSHYTSMCPYDALATAVGSRCRVLCLFPIIPSTSTLNGGWTRSIALSLLCPSVSLHVVNGASSSQISTPKSTKSSTPSPTSPRTVPGFKVTRGWVQRYNLTWSLLVPYRHFLIIRKVSNSGKTLILLVCICKIWTKCGLYGCTNISTDERPVTSQTGCQLWATGPCTVHMAYAVAPWCIFGGDRDTNPVLLMDSSLICALVPNYRGSNSCSQLANLRPGATVPPWARSRTYPPTFILAGH